MDKIIIYTDGGSRGNPGPAAIGILIEGTRNQGRGGREYSEFIGEATNNEAEYKAVIFALKKAKQLIGKKNAENAKIEIHLDSELVGKQMQGKYKILEPELQPLFIQVWNLKQDFGEVTFKIVPRSENKRADQLVNQVLNERARKQMQTKLL